MLKNKDNVIKYKLMVYGFLVVVVSKTKGSVLLFMDVLFIGGIGGITGIVACGIDVVVAA
jgi:hypothetical protein